MQAPAATRSVGYLDDGAGRSPPLDDFGVGVMKAVIRPCAD